MIARSHPVIEAVVERVHDATITERWLRRHTALTSKAGLQVSALTLTVTSPRRAQVVRVANMYATVFANTWRPQAEAPLRRAVLSGNIKVYTYCGVHDGKACERRVPARRLLAGMLRGGMSSHVPKMRLRCLCDVCRQWSAASSARSWASQSACFSCAGTPRCDRSGRRAVHRLGSTQMASLAWLRNGVHWQTRETSNPRDGTKLCSNFRLRLPVDRFAVNEKLSSGLDSWCKQCHLEATREYRRRHKAAVS